MPSTPTLLIPLVLLATACSGGTKPDVFVPPTTTDSAGEDTEDAPLIDTDDPAIVDTTPPTTYDCSNPPGLGLQHVCDFSVNNAEVKILDDLASKPLFLFTANSASTPPGNYTGQGTGNRALAGFHGYDRKPLSEIGTISYDGEKVTGTESRGPDIMLLVDLGCDSSAYITLIAPYSALTVTDLPEQSQWVKRYTALEAASVWFGTKGLLDPTDPETIILQDRDIAATQMLPAGRLVDVTTAYPDACIRNLVLTDDVDPEVPPHASLSAFMLALNRAGDNQNKNEWRITRVLFDDDEHLPPN